MRTSPNSIHRNRARPSSSKREPTHVCQLHAEPLGHAADPRREPRWRATGHRLVPRQHRPQVPVAAQRPRASRSATRSRSPARGRGSRRCRRAGRATADESSACARSSSRPSSSAIRSDRAADAHGLLSLDRPSSVSVRDLRQHLAFSARRRRSPSTSSSAWRTRPRSRRPLLVERPDRSDPLSPRRVGCRAAAAASDAASRSSSPAISARMSAFPRASSRRGRLGSSSGRSSSAAPKWRAAAWRRQSATARSPAVAQSVARPLSLGLLPAARPARGREVVVGEQLGVVFAAAERLDPAGGETVLATSLGTRDLRIGDIADEHVVERVLGLARDGGAAAPRRNSCARAAARLLDRRSELAPTAATAPIQRSRRRPRRPGPPPSLER